MLKSMNSVIILVILCGRIQSINGEALQCEFKNQGFIWGTMYTCHVSSLDNSRNDKVINSYTGTHLANRNDNDVKAIRIYVTKTKNIPAGLGSLFNLTAFVVEFSQLVEIKAENFLGMQNLEYLSLWGNQIIYIGSDAFGQLTNLKNVYLSGNICVNKNYKEKTEINQMKIDIKLTCDKANDVIQYEITNELKELRTGIQEDALMNQEELKKLMNKLLKASEEHQENLILRTDLSIAQDQQKTAQDERDQLKKELNDLKRDFTEAKETIEQKLPKLEQTIEDFYMEVMDLKIERHNERQNSISLRSKLMEAKEQLATCEINERSLD